MSREHTKSRLEELFRGRSKKALLMPYITAGYPSLHECRHVLESFISGGADMIELGVPFSDPLADGPTVQASAQQALDQGVTPDDVLALAGEFSGRIPVVLLVYYNNAFAYGVEPGPEEFIAAAAAAGIAGLIVPDLPVDEAGSFVDICHSHGMDAILLVAPTSTAQRIAQVAEKASGFIYCVSVAGVTGARTELSDQLPAFLGRVREGTDVPLAVGFGVSTPEQAAQVAGFADGVIIGSRLIRMVGDAGDIDVACRAVEQFLNQVNEELS